MAIRVRIWWDEASQSYMLSLVPSPQLKPFVDLLKKAVPSGDRDYDPTTHFWYFKEGYAEGIRLLAQSIYSVSSVSFTSRVVVEQARQQQPVGLPTTPIKQAFAEFIAMVNEDGSKVISYEQAKRAYRLKSRDLHPDHGGDPAKMSQLNALWARIEREYYSK